MMNITVSSKKYSTTIFFTWNLFDNVEVNMCEFNNTSLGQISFGIDPGFHFSFNKGKYFDLELGVPLPYFN